MSMVDLFGLLGIQRSPSVSEETVESAFTRAALTAHPDRDGGSTERMAALNLARKTLLSPALCIGHFLELEGYQKVERGAVPDVVGALFGDVVSVLNRARVVVEKRDAASSAITRAVVAGEVREVLRAVEVLDEQVRDRGGRLERDVADWVTSGEVGMDALDTLRRALAFTARWQQQLAEARAVLGGATRGA